jgi:hypothetical protein
MHDHVASTASAVDDRPDFLPLARRAKVRLDYARLAREKLA